MAKIGNIKIVSKTTLQGLIGEIRIDFEGETDEDFLMVQEIMRSFISANFCRDSTFGYDEKLEPIIVFDYPKNRELTLVAKLDEKSTSFEFLYRTPNKTDN